MQHGYSLFHVKSIDTDLREIRGVASTPTLDRAGDIVQSTGALFGKSLPLLLYHDTTKPVGQVKLAKPTANGIDFTAQLPQIDTPGPLKDRVDEAWQSIRAGLVKGVSIGFRVLDDGIELLKTGGVKFTKFEILELSLVAIPANAEATITSIKSFDAEHLAASGHVIERTGDSSIGSWPATAFSIPSGASDSPAAKAAAKGARPMAKDIHARKLDFEAEKAAKVAKMNELMGADDGTTLDEAQQEEFDTLTDEIKTIETHLSRLETLERVNKAAAAPVTATTVADAAAQRTSITQPAQSVITVKETLPPGFQLARMVMCKMASLLAFEQGNVISALEIAKQRFPDDQRVHQYLVQKTAVAGGTTTDSVWAAPLLATAQSLESEFLEYLRPQTIVGKFGTNGIPSLRRVPFNVKIASQTTGGAANWVGEGKPKPLTKFEYADQTLLFTKIAAIAVITEELARFSRPGAEQLVRDALADAVIAKMDTDFIDPAVSASSGVRPASITNGLTALTSAGPTADNARTDIQNILEQYVLNNVNVAGLVLIMPNTLALALSNMFTTLAQPQFAGLNINGGTLLGIPVITSQYAASGASYGNMVIAVNARDVALADDGRVTVDASREASLQMDDAPSNDATTGTGQVSVSMWQTNSIALRAEREIHWKKLRSSAVVFMDDVNWGSIGSPV